MSKIRQIDARIPVVFVTLTRSADSAIEAMKQGAYDYLLKPLDVKKLSSVIGEALKVARLMREPAFVTETPLGEDIPGEAIVGCCPAMQEVYKAIGRVADQTFPVLITGESGTGKELVARAVYQHGPRAKAPFLALNCAAIPEQLLESELFGHEKGAFTGADRRRIGKFEQCHGGTIFLDEIGDMPLVTQAKILRLLQEQAFERVGGNETIRTDVRLIAATHRDLKAWSAEGKFRTDLYYRVGVFTIHLPPLRERGDDLPLLVQHFLRRFRRELGARSARLPPRRWSASRVTRGRETSESCRASSSRACSRPAAQSCSQPFCLSRWKGREKPALRRRRCRPRLLRRSFGSGSGQTQATCMRRRTSGSTKSCSRWSFSIPTAFSAKPPRSWASAGKRSAKDSANSG